MKNNQTNEPTVYKFVRAVGVLRPQYQPNSEGPIFADKLNVLGTAFWLKDYNVLVTCSHVVQDLVRAPIEMTGLLVVGNRGKYSRASVAMFDYMHDLAVLVLHPEVNNPEPTPTEGIEIIKSYPEVGTEVAYAGFPLGEQLLDSTEAPTYAEGVVGAKLRQRNPIKEIQITGAATGGFSGSPIVSKNEPQKLIGVLSNSPSKQAGEANIFMAISWEHVKAIAELAIS